jgi:hypothetical protein
MINNNTLEKGVTANMMNGARCRTCGTFVYARNISGRIDPESFVCDACREFECVGVNPATR